MKTLCFPVYLSLLVSEHQKEAIKFLFLLTYLRENQTVQFKSEHTYLHGLPQNNKCLCILAKTRLRQKKKKKKKIFATQIKLTFMHSNFQRLGNVRKLIHTWTLWTCSYTRLNVCDRSQGNETDLMYT